MGEETKEEEKKQEEKKEEGGEAKEGGVAEEKKKEEGEGEKKEDEKKKEEENPEIVLKVDMHCEGCARKVQRSLRGFPGVEEVYTDSKTHKVVVKGKAADPLKVCERIQKNSGKKVEIISPLPKPPEEKEEEEPPKQEEEKKEEPAVVTVVLTVRMHCESCALVIQRRIHKLKGVESVETDLKNDKVVVKGVVDPEMLVQYIYKQTRKQATIVPPPPPPPPEEEKKEEEEKQQEKVEGEKKEEEERKVEEDEKNEVKKKMEYWPYWPPPQYYYPEQPYPPQIFSDENPNACSVM